MYFILILVAVGVVAFVIVTYNNMVGLRFRADNSWADIDVQLKRRYNLIPNLVETVKGYATHEQDTLEKVIQARNTAMSAQGPAAKGEAEGVLSGMLRQVFALAESYPQLRAVETFAELQGQLSSLEDAVQNARRYYNAVVRDYNTKIGQFPSNLIAQQFKFELREFFELKEPEQREAPKVSFDKKEPAEPVK